MPMGIAEKAIITARLLRQNKRECHELQDEIAQLQEDHRHQQDVTNY
jgi:hypothetical protein